jgi:hypothetical protein
MLSTQASLFAYFLTEYLQICWEHTTSVHVIKHSLIFGLWTYYKSPQVAWATYLLCSRITHVLGVYLSLDGLSPKLVKTYYGSPPVTSTTYYSCPRTARGITTHSCVHLLIFERILSIFGGGHKTDPQRLHWPFHVSVLTVRTSPRSRFIHIIWPPNVAKPVTGKDYLHYNLTCVSYD